MCLCMSAPRLAIGASGGTEAPSVLRATYLLFQFPPSEGWRAPFIACYRHVSGQRAGVPANTRDVKHQAWWPKCTSEGGRVVTDVEMESMGGGHAGWPGGCGPDFAPPNGPLMIPW